MDSFERRRLIREHLDAIRDLQEEEAQTSPGGWPPRGYYLLWHVVVGMMLGLIGGAVSLTANVVGAPLFGLHPLQLIRVYLTFPMGEAALTDAGGKVLTVGCILYLLTGAIYGIVFHLVLSTSFTKSSALRRFLAATILGLVIWVINFYGILLWLQPALLGGDWIVNLVPFWVAALTHLAFAWTVLAIEFWARFVPYEQVPVSA